VNLVSFLVLQSAYASFSNICCSPNYLSNAVCKFIKSSFLWVVDRQNSNAWSGTQGSEQLSYSINCKSITVRRRFELELIHLINRVEIYLWDKGISNFFLLVSSTTYDAIIQLPTNQYSSGLLSALNWWNFFFLQIHSKFIVLMEPPVPNLLGYLQEQSKLRTKILNLYV